MLANEIAAIPEAIRNARGNKEDGNILLARLIPGLSVEKWRDATHSNILTHWHAFPVEAITEEDLEEMEKHTNELCLSPFREAGGALTKDMFVSLLKRELSRFNRTGGDLSLLCVAITDRNRLLTAIGSGAVSRLEAILGVTILSLMENCDSMGVLKKGYYICTLPGFGQLAARNFAEKCQLAFEEAARPFFPSGGISAGNGADCAVGIINILQGEKTTARELLKRAKSSLEIAMERSANHIYQESTALPVENATLVQSNEKRFLFFGGQSS